MPISNSPNKKIEIEPLKPLKETSQKISEENVEMLISNVKERAKLHKENIKELSKIFEELCPEEAEKLS